MWSPEELAIECVHGEVGKRFLGADDVAELSPSELTEAATRVLARPQQAEGNPLARPLTRRLLAGQWTRVLGSLGLPECPKVLELCAGGSDPVVMALDVLFGARAEYVTVNLNRRLASELTANCAHLDLRIRIVEDDARNLEDHFERGSFDCVCFHHAVNDILETAVAAAHDYDTRDIDWWPNERMMIEWLAEQDAADGLESVGLPELRAIVSAAARAVRPGGWLVFDHWTFEHHLSQDWFPGELFTRMIPLAREVAVSLDLGLTEVTPEGLDPRWWMVLRRD